MYGKPFIKTKTNICSTAVHLKTIPAFQRT